MAAKASEFLLRGNNWQQIKRVVVEDEVKEVSDKKK